MRQPVSAEEFVRIWQTSVTVAEVCARLKITRGGARVRAADLRQRGVPLKEMHGGRPKLDIEALAKLARELEK